MQKQHARWRNTTNKRTWKRPRLINDYNEEDMILEKGNTKRIIYLCNKIEATKLYNHIEDISYHLAKIIVGTSVFWCYVSVLYTQFYCNTLNSLNSHSIHDMGIAHCNIFLYLGTYNFQRNTLKLRLKYRVSSIQCPYFRSTLIALNQCFISWQKFNYPVQRIPKRKLESMTNN